MNDKAEPQHPSARNARDARIAVQRTEEYASGFFAYQKCGDSACCPFPIGGAENRRARWFTGLYDAKFLQVYSDWLVL